MADHDVRVEGIDEDHLVDDREGVIGDESEGFECQKRAFLEGKNREFLDEKEIGEVIQNPCNFFYLHLYNTWIL